MLLWLSAEELGLCGLGCVGVRMLCVWMFRMEVHTLGNRYVSSSLITRSVGNSGNFSVSSGFTFPALEM